MAFSPVMTETTLLLDTFVVFLINELSKRMLLRDLLYRFSIFLFRSFHASCLYFNDFCAFTAFVTFAFLASTIWAIILSVSMPDIRPLNLMGIFHPSFLYSDFFGTGCPHCPVSTIDIVRCNASQLP